MVEDEKMEEDTVEEVVKMPEVVVNTRVVEVLDNEASPGLRRSRGRVSCSLGDKWLFLGPRITQVACQQFQNGSVPGNARNLNFIKQGQS